LKGHISGLIFRLFVVRRYPGEWGTSLESSISIVKSCLRGHKLPEPARLAHEYAKMCKSGISKKKIFVWRWMKRKS